MFTPVLAKHTERFNLIDSLAVGVERIQRNFEPMQRQVEDWRKTQISDERAKLILYAGLWKRPERSFLRLAARPISGMNLRPKSWPCRHSTYIVGAMCYVTD